MVRSESLIAAGDPGHARDHLPSRLSEHIHHLHLEHGVDSLNADTRTALRHRKNVHNAHRKVVDKLSKHQAHDLHGYTCPTVPEHLEDGEGGDVHGFGVIDQIGVILAQEW